MTSLVSSLLSMYNTALPHEYLELVVPTLPTPPSSTENSVPTQWGGHEYLAPKEANETNKDQIYVPDSRVTVGSLPDNYHPAVTAHSDLTAPAGYQNSVCGNMGHTMNKTHNHHNSHLINSLQNINDICKASPTDGVAMIGNTMLPSTSRIYSGSYRGVLVSRVSTESGYGTTRSSVESEKEKMWCKCRYGAENDDVFFDEDGTKEHLINDTDVNSL